MRVSRRSTLLLLAVLAVIGLGASAVALTSRNSREFIAGSNGVAGKAEIADFAGLVVATGNFDGDRFTDVIVGSPLEDRGPGRDAGQIQVFYGSRDGLKASRDRILHPGTPGVAGDAQESAHFGAAVVVADLDGDGYDDAAVGAPGQMVDGVSGAGMVVLLFGGENGLSGAGSVAVTQQSLAAESAPGSGHRFGQSLAAADLDADGYVDVAIGAPGDTSAGPVGAGGVGILRGSATGFAAEIETWLTQDTDGVEELAEADDHFGWSLATGDFDGDTIADLAVGVPGETHADQAGAGVVHVFPGSAEGLELGGAVYSENTPGVSSRSKPDDQFGASLAAGDFDGDAVSDLAIGIPGKSWKGRPDTGSVQVLPGSDTGLTGSGSTKLSQKVKSLGQKPHAGDDFGAALAVGDFNDNGRDDLAVGVPGERVDDLVNAGVVHAFYGRGAGISKEKAETWTLGSGGMPGLAQAGAGAGWALAAGDFDGDGRDDLVVGVPGRTVGKKGAAGSFVVLYG